MMRATRQVYREGLLLSWRLSWLRRVVWPWLRRGQWGAAKEAFQATFGKGIIGPPEETELWR